LNPHIFRRFGLLAATAVFCFVALLGCGGVGMSNLYDNGAVATSSAIATEVGIGILNEGGTAVDAAIAVAFTLAVVHPEAGNIGGGGFAVVYDSETRAVRALDFRETAPAAASGDMYLDDTGAVIPGLSTHGALAVGVPGTVAGLHELWKKHGTMTWERLVQPVAELADTGFIVDEYLSRQITRHRDGLAAFESSAAIFLPGGRPLSTGDRLQIPDLAKTLYIISSEGPEGFYAGETADKLVATMAKHGGIITAEDLAGYEPIWRTAVRFEFDSLQIYSMPPPSSGGICLGQILKLLEEFDFSRLSPKSPKYVHLFAEAARLAYADRAVHLGDPDFFDVPTGFLDDAYLKGRRQLIDTLAAGNSDNVGEGVPGAESTETTHFSILDADGNAVSLTYTLNTGFGSKLVVDGAGFLLNNEMDDFTSKPGVPNTYGLIQGESNKIEPGKRMLSSMSPTIIMRDGEPVMVVGSPGGGRIITSVAQTIINVTRFGMDIDEAVNHPRFHHQYRPDMIYLEQDGYDINLKQALIGMGHNINECAPYSDVQAILRDENGLISAASDLRGNGLSAGY